MPSFKRKRGGGQKKTVTTKEEKSFSGKRKEKEEEKEEELFDSREEEEEEDFEGEEEEEEEDFGEESEEEEEEDSDDEEEEEEEEEEYVDENAVDEPFVELPPDEEEEEEEEEREGEEDGERNGEERDGEEIDFGGAAAFEPDSDDEEVDIENMNTVGNIPMEWYDDYDHIGYNLKGEKILKSTEVRDALDQFLEKEENPSAHWRTVFDKKNQKEVVLSKKDMQMLLRVGDGQYPSSDFDPYFDAIDPAVTKDIHPVTNTPAPKRRFVPSKWEGKRVAYLVKAIRKGWISLEDKPLEEPRQSYLLWKEDAEPQKHRGAAHIPAPKVKLPTHAESFNPPDEYLLSKEELKELKQMDPSDRPYNYIPHKFRSHREIPAYRNIFKERFERCLDLYLCPRSIKLKQKVNPKDLLPKLPPKSDLRPFPTMVAVKYIGHRKMIRSLSVHKKGQWLATGSDDETVRVWEVSTGRCVRVVNVGGVVEKLAWCPREDVMILAVVVKRRLLLINATIGSETSVAHTQATFVGVEMTQKKEITVTTETKTEDQKSEVIWTKLIGRGTDPSDKKSKQKEREEERKREREEAQKEGIEFEDGKLIEAEGAALLHRAAVKSVVWHWKGDYFATVIEGDQKQVLVHRLSTHKSQAPFRSLKGFAQCVQFHPSKPLFYVATQQYIRIYDLSKQELVKRVSAAVKWVSSMAIHPLGDDLIVGSYDKKICWFEIELSSKPFRILRYHSRAVRGVTFHERYPLWGSVSDDGKLHVFHATVYPDDYSKDPMIVPLKIISAHQIVDGFGVMDVAFHPMQPWAFTCGGDGAAFLYV